MKSEPDKTDWSRLPLRKTFYSDAPQDKGSGVAGRMQLSSAIPAGLYKYIVDQSGVVWVGVDRDHTPNHSSLVLAEEPVRAAGNIRISDDGVAYVNAFSGHYMVERPFDEQDESLFIELMTIEIKKAGLIVGRVTGDNSPLPKPPRQR